MTRPHRLVAAAVILLAGTVRAQAPAQTQSQSGGLPVTYERLLQADREPGNWLMYSGDYRSHHFSSLKQITSENIQRLHPAWIYQMHRSKVETTPIVVDGIMYVTRPPDRKSVV